MALQTNSGTEQKERELVTFRLDEQEFGLSIMNVQEIVRMLEITRIPRAPVYVEGIANLRGNVLPVINTRQRFSMSHADATDRTRVVVVDVNGKNVGLVVDAVSEVMRVQESSIEPPPKVVSGDLDADFLEGVLKLNQGERLVMTLNPEKVCDIQVIAQQKTTELAQGVTRGQTETGTKETLDEQQLVTFTLRGEEYALDIQSVREIIRIPEVVKVPRAPSYVRGLISLRNRLLPLIDLRNLFSQPLIKEEQQEQIALLQEKQEAGNQWWTNLNAVLKENHKENELLQIPVFSLKDWATSSHVNHELMKTVLEKLAKVVAALENATLELNRIPFKKVSPYVNTTMTPLVKRMNELFKELALATENNDEQRVVVAESNGFPFGLIVDKVNEVMRIEKRLIDPPPSMVSEDEKQKVQGVAKLNKGKRLIMILDSKNLLEMKVLKELANSHEQNVEAETSTLEQQSIEEEQFVTFRLENEEFGIRIMQIQEINRLTEITKVPKAPNFVSGVTNLRGTVVPVVDLRIRFSMETKEADDRTRVVIIDVDGKKTGLIVDQVHEVLRLLKADIEPPPEVVSSDSTNEFISGIGKLNKGKRMLVLLDVEKILTRSEKAQLSQVASNLKESKNNVTPAGTAKRVDSTAPKSTSVRKTLKKADE
ncbi:chemotaxis protein CheW [Deltaproteobacteria bacterium TL4]